MGKRPTMSQRVFRRVLESWRNFPSNCGHEEFVKAMSHSSLMSPNVVCFPLKRWWKNLCSRVTVQLPDDCFKTLSPRRWYHYADNFLRRPTSCVIFTTGVLKKAWTQIGVSLCSPYENLRMTSRSTAAMTVSTLT